jgi:phosphopantothenoylcysteine decarboxylase/phosphopantothenate--cysteine ligase
MLAGKKILLGVSGSIAAYKAAFLTRLLVKSGAEVKVIMTPSAHDFITPLTLATLSKNPVLTHFTKSDTGEWNNHVELGLWADALVVAPATANTLAKMVAGTCDNLLTAVYLSARCPVFLGPAMDLDMLQHPSTRRNIETLERWGHHQLNPTFGELASGLIGTGRMAEPQEIVTYLAKLFFRFTLKGKKSFGYCRPNVRGDLDPVRFIGNHSTGKMGFAIAEELSRQGAQVTLVTGPTNLNTSISGIEIVSVTSAEEMYQACVAHFENTDVTVLSAAVADYKPATLADQKIKKTSQVLTIELVSTRDIAAELGKLKKNGQLVVGFALETENERANAEKKIKSKNFDLIVLNSLQDAGAGFGHDTNKITLIDAKNNATEFNLKSKKEVARDIVKAIIDLGHG